MRWKHQTGIILLWQISASICFYTIYAVTPFIRETFDVSTTAVGIMVTVLMLGYTVFVVPIGSIIDRLGEARVLFFGLIGLGIATVGVTLSWSYATLLVAVFILGLFYATAIPGTNKAVFNTIPFDRQNTSMGIKQVGVTAGSGISAILIPYFGVTRFGWETGFLITAFFAFLISVVFYLVYPNDDSAINETKSVAIGTHFKNLNFTSLTAAGFFLGAGLFTTIGYTILYVHESIGASVVFAGIVLASAQFFGSVGRIVSGLLADWMSTSPQLATIRILIVQSVCATALLILVAVVDGVTFALILFSLLGFFILGFTGIYYSCIGAMISVEHMGSATAGGQIALNGGAIIAPPLFGYIVDIYGYRPAWLLMAGAGLCGLIMLLLVEFRTRNGMS